MGRLVRPAYQLQNAAPSYQSPIRLWERLPNHVAGTSSTPLVGPRMHEPSSLPDVNLTYLSSISYWKRGDTSNSSLPRSFTYKFQLHHYQVLLRTTPNDEWVPGSLPALFKARLISQEFAVVPPPMPQHPPKN